MILMDFKRKQNRQAFTMIEIALSLGVIAFAIVAIIGVLPLGLNTQRESREETIVNQDGPLLLEAIRNGARGLDYLTNHVEWVAAGEMNTGTGTNFYDTGAFPTVQGAPSNYIQLNATWNGLALIGLLTRPKYYYASPIGTNVVTNRVTAKIHSISGAVAEHAGEARELGFTYRLLVETVPATSLFASTNLYGTSRAGDTNASLEMTNRIQALKKILPNELPVYDPNVNAYEVRLTFQWPILPNGNVGRRRAQFRTLVGARLQRAQTTNAVDLFYFQPQQFQTP